MSLQYLSRSLSRSSLFLVLVQLSQHHLSTPCHNNSSNHCLLQHTQQQWQQWQHTHQ